MGKPNFSDEFKRERIRLRTYKTRKQDRQDVFDYIEPNKIRVGSQLFSGIFYRRVEIAKDHVGASCEELLGVGKPKAARSSGNKNSPVVEAYRSAARHAVSSNR